MPPNAGPGCDLHAVRPTAVGTGVGTSTRGLPGLRGGDNLLLREEGHISSWDVPGVIHTKEICAKNTSNRQGSLEIVEHTRKCVARIKGNGMQLRSARGEDSGHVVAEPEERIDGH